jgi:hypothetical protein
MITPTTGALKIVPTPSLFRFKDVGFKFFDDDKTVYVSPKTFERIGSGDLKSLNYIMLSWKSTDTTIDAVAKDLDERFLNLKTSS